MGGGARPLAVCDDAVQGRSPRGRRSLSGKHNTRLRVGSISAWAEEPGAVGTRLERVGVDLRVGGGARSRVSEIDAPNGRSPRGRRSLVAGYGNDPSDGSISAWAEEPRRNIVTRASFGVDLRVGGGAFSCF